MLLFRYSITLKSSLNEILDLYKIELCPIKLKKKRKKKKSMELEFLNAAIADQTKKKKAWNSGITYSYVFVVLSVAVGVPCIFFFLKKFVRA